MKFMCNHMSLEISAFQILVVDTDFVVFGSPELCSGLPGLRPPGHVETKAFTSLKSIVNFH